MFRVKLFISIVIFSLLLVGTSILKNQTRDIEKKIYQLNKDILLMERDFNESQLDFSYLTSPVMIERKIEYLDHSQYFPMNFSNIYLDISTFIDLQNKFAVQELQDEKKTQKK